MPTQFSQFWYRIAALRPRLRSHIEIHRQQYRDETWFILQDQSSPQQHRFSAAAYKCIGVMDGQRTVQEILELLEANGDDQAPTPDDLSKLIAQLHEVDAIQCEITPDLGELLLRGERQSRRQWQNRLNPLSGSFRLFDPDRLLTLLVPALSPLQGWVGALLWIAVVGLAALQAAIHWSELTHDVIDRILTPQNLAVIWLLFPVLKMFHEFGHGLHGMFADTEYPSLSGTSVARDFVEFPSQFNEHWASYPTVFKHFAKNYKTGEPMPDELAAKIKKAAKFNQGYELTELLSAAELDMQWHTLPADAPLQNPDTFEKEALQKTHLDISYVPPRYRSSYFMHIWGNGYAAGYYAYLWTEMLDDDAYQWFEDNGGLTRANGDRFRRMILSRGNTEDLAKMYATWLGKEPNVEPMLKDRGLEPSGK